MEAWGTKVMRKTCVKMYIFYQFLPVFLVKKYVA